MSLATTDPGLPFASSPPPVAVRAATPRAGGARKPTSPLAHGEPLVWIMGAGLVLCIVMIAGILALVAVHGAATFWPRPIDRVALRDGTTFLGIPLRDEQGPDGPRRLYRTGNRDAGLPPFRWVDLAAVAGTERPPDALLLDRRNWGIWLGEPTAVTIERTDLLPPDAAPVPLEIPPGAQRGRQTDDVLETLPDGSRRVRSRVYLAEGAAPTLAALASAQPEAAARFARIEAGTRETLGPINGRIERARLDLRALELEAARRAGDPLPALPRWAFGGLAALATIALAVSGPLARRRPSADRSPRAGRVAVRLAIAAVGIAAALAATLEHPWSRTPIPAERIEAARASTARLTAALEAEYARAVAELAALRVTDDRLRVIVTDPATGRFAPRRQTEPDEPLPLSQVTRVTAPNAEPWSGKLAIYLDRWWSFLSEEPRDANTDGGVFPVIFGTVVLTILLSIAVVPLGVVAALYLREYARQGPLVSLIRIAVNNLAGVPSIVYGVFGLGFFCYTVGGYIDRGSPLPAPRSLWWIGLGGVLLSLILGATLAAAARTSPESRPRPFLARLVALCWALAVALAIWLVASTPYFSGFFAEKLPSPTYGGKGILWGALTLALLTLPVVIVATEEAIAAVPRSVREGSYGCGGSKWQTIRRIVLPQALPGIMTGAILAMARGAGEVAPLMLVGAVKLAPELPVSGDFPFIHPERSFMHLGFHIYDLGFQSPDSEAARPLVWTTTLLLVLIVLVLNLAAILVRGRLRARVINASV